MRRAALLFLPLFALALSACAVEGGGPVPIKPVSLRATKGAPCAPARQLAYEKEGFALLVCADNDRKGFVWRRVGSEAPVTQTGKTGEACANEGSLGRDASGALLYCGNDPEETP